MTLELKLDYIKFCVDSHKNKFSKSQKIILTEEEKMLGFLDTKPPIANYNNSAGKIFENIMSYNSISRGEMGGTDWINDKSLNEAKNRHNTWNGKACTRELPIQLKYAIDNNINYNLFINNDFQKKQWIHQKVPLHMKKPFIKKVEGYNPQKHFWISGNECWKEIYGDDWLICKQFYLQYLKEEYLKIVDDKKIFF